MPFWKRASKPAGRSDTHKDVGNIYDRQDEQKQVRRSRAQSALLRRCVCRPLSTLNLRKPGVRRRIKGGPGWGPPLHSAAPPPAAHPPAPAAASKSAHSTAICAAASLHHSFTCRRIPTKTTPTVGTPRRLRA